MLHLQRQLDGHTITLNLNRRSADNPTFRITFTHPIHGRFRISTGTDNPELAAAFARDLDLNEYLHEQITQRANARTLPDTPHPKQGPGGPHFRHLAAYYTDTLMPNRGRAERTIHGARQCLAEFTYFLQSRHLTHARQITPQVLEHFITWRRKEEDKNKTIAQKLIWVRAVLRAAVKFDLLDEMPIREWPTLKTTPPEIQPFTRQELTAAITAVSEHAPQHLAIITFIAATGIRPSDARTLTPAHLDLHQGIYYKHTQKTGHPVNFPLGPALTQLLRHRITTHKIQPNQPLFLNQGKPYSHNGLLRAFKSALTKANHPAAPWANIKTLRHTFAYLMLNDLRCSIRDVQHLMGHTDIKTTAKYIRPTDTRTHTTTYETYLFPLAPAPQNPTEPS